MAQGVVTIIRNPENYDIQLRANDDEPYVFSIDELSNEKTQKEKIPDREHMLGKISLYLFNLIIKTWRNRKIGKVESKVIRYGSTVDQYVQISKGLCDSIWG